ncbi:MAG: hypothetical protein LC650_05375 [Actinobacteria bacterium]|nr:hypothetical protein [Actinomycetota bacterium]
MAQEGDPDALLFLYRKSRRAIGYVFWKHFIGPNKRFLARRLSRGDDDFFAAEAWHVMLKALESFDVSKYAREATDNFLGKWHWWFQQYLKNATIRLNKEIDRQGFTGVGAQAGDMPTTTSMPVDDAGRDVETVNLSHPSHASEIETEESLRQYMDDLKRDVDTSKDKREKFDLLNYRLEGMSIEDIAEIMGTTAWNIRKKLRSLKDDMIQYGIFEGSMRLFDIGQSLKEASYNIVPAWEPISNLTLNQALRFRRRKISDMITHHVSPSYLIVETNLPNRKTTYTIYFRLPTKTAMRGDLEYANHVDLLVSNHRTPRVVSFSMAKNLCKYHFQSRGEAVKGGVDPASPQAWLHAL